MFHRCFNLSSYGRILKRINNFRSPSKEIARKLLGWIACSPTPLTVREAQQALAIKCDDKEGEIRILQDLEMESLCGPIIEVTDDHIQFAHFTVKE